MNRKTFLLSTVSASAFVLLRGYAQTQPNPKPSNSSKMLIVYFSHSGNTRVIAEQIKATTGADICEIQTVTPYPSDYQTVVKQARKEIDAKYKPELKTKIENIGSYDVIFVGSPNWWATIAPPIATFLSSYDLSGKTVVPFITHEGSRMGRSVSDIKELAAKSTILNGLPVRGGSVKSAQNDVSAWLRQIGLVKQ
ncbi:MAG: NAD(P)H-dependent oxidoreductase [Puniceicoccales bacterium]|jgi:flavodoxin|nr:NAD(P)H-dependent oxidoreductase [Puniceicoccales bacterium]